MAGYLGHSMSNNAAAAYKEGVKPLSKITAPDLIQAGWKKGVPFAKYLALLGLWKRSEYHHSSKFFNKVDFYAPQDLVEAWENLDECDASAFTVSFKEKKKDDETGVKVEGTFLKWDGKKPAGDVAFTGIKIGNWIHLDGGGRKKATGNYISFKCI